MINSGPVGALAFVAFYIDTLSTVFGYERHIYPDVPLPIGNDMYLYTLFWGVVNWLARSRWKFYLCDGVIITCSSLAVLHLVNVLLWLSFL